MLTDMRARLALVLAGALLTACSSTVVGGLTGTGGTGGGATTTGTGGAGAIDCAHGVFPAFDKACTVYSECAVEIHQIDCCGSTAAIGVAASESAAFQAAEKACDAMYPGCGCAGRGPVAEDGKLGTAGQIQVACTMGKCTTFVP
jgi:hypothetical protein